MWVVMKRYQKNLLITFVILLGIYGCWQAVFPFGWFNYKLTLVVNTPEGQKVGSSVRKIIVAKMPKLLPDEHGGQIDVRGEALVVDLGERGVLFALLKEGKSIGSDAKRIIFKEFPTDHAIYSRSGISYYRNLEAKKELAFDRLPMLVRFRDMNDPKTVELVDPNDLAASFGEGVKLKSATIEMTNEAVTTGVEKYLRWLPEYYNKKLDGNRYEGGNAPATLANKLSSGSFSAGVGVKK